MSFVWFLLIGLAAGWLAGQMMKGRGFGLVGNLVVGVVGGVIGGAVFDSLGIGGEGLLGSLIAAVVGAVLLLVVIGLVVKPKKG
ncbi:MAG: GlsB/YeaQ/YmgE family stress response membrane protein [Phycisphaerales bacterium JB043]